MKEKYTYLIVILLIVVSCAAFVRAVDNDFINFDDNAYITENNYVQSGLNLQSIKWASTAKVVGNWHPLTLLSHILDWSLFGANASGHHLVSLILHISTVIFLFLFLYKTTNNIWPSAFATALFALHPLRVESVAWASERKDVLSMFFGMACLYAYAFYAELPKISKYLLCLILFSLALMSKPMLITLPFVMMLLDYWPLKRWQRAMNEPSKGFNSVGGLILEKVPFVCLTIADSIVTFWAQDKDKLVKHIEQLPITERFSNAIISYATYLGKTLWPFHLAVFYPYEHSFPSWQILISCFILLGITIFVVYYIKKLPYLFVGWFWYLGTLIPVIGLVQVGIQARADHYSYLPSVGIAIMLAWGVPLLFQFKKMRKKILFPAGTIFLAILAVLTWQQCGYWKNNATIFSHAVQVTKDNYLAHNNLATALVEEGKIKEAISHYNEAILIKPDYALAYNNRAIIYIYQGNNKLGCRDLQKACDLKECELLKTARGKGYCL